MESFVIFVIFEGGKFCKHLFILIDNDDECFFCFLEEFDKGGYIRKNNIRIVWMVHNGSSWHLRYFVIFGFFFWKNDSFQDILYAMTNTITTIMALIKICIVLTYKGKFLNLIAYMQRNFWNVNYDYREKEILDDCRKTCTFFISSVTTIGMCTVISYLTTPVISGFK